MATKYKSTAITKGAELTHTYGSLNYVKRKGIAWLTMFEPGHGELWPQRLEIFVHVKKLSRNQASWKLIETIQYEDVPQDQHEWRRAKQRREAAKPQAAPTPPKVAWSLGSKMVFEVEIHKTGPDLAPTWKVILRHQEFKSEDETYGGRTVEESTMPAGYNYKQTKREAEALLSRLASWALA